MKARRTHNSNQVLGLRGGTEDNDLWIRSEGHSCGHVTMTSVWEPTPEEREAIANGENVELIVWGKGHPPVMVRTTDVPLGKAPAPELNLTHTMPMTQEAAITLGEKFMSEYEADTGERLEKPLKVRYIDSVNQEQVIEVDPPEEPTPKKPDDGDEGKPPFEAPV